MKKMVKYIKSIFVIMLIVNAGLLHAQDSLKANVFHVDKVLKPMLSESMKIQSNPNPEVPEIKSPVFEYTNIPDSKHNAAPTIYTIKPLSMGTALLPKLKNNYTKVGYGNYNSPLLEIYLNTVRNKDLQAGVFVKHFSANPDGYNTFSNNTVDAFVKKFSPNAVIEADVNYTRNNAYLYGFNTDSVKPLHSDVQQLFQNVGVNASYSNIVKDSNSLMFKAGFSFYGFYDSHSNVENNFGLFGNFTKRVQGNPLEIHTKLDIISNTFTLYPTTLQTDIQRTYFDLNPRYTLNNGDVYLKLGFNSTVATASGSSKIHFFPVAEAGYSLIPKSLTAYSGITGNVKQNNFKTISNENPFVRDITFKNSIDNNTINKFEVYAGIKGILGAQTSFALSASWKTLDNMLFYVTDSIIYNPQKVVYDNCGLMNLKAELLHEFADQFRVGITVNYYSYSSFKLLNQPYGRPTFETKLNAMYNMGDKFILHADIFTMDQRYTKLLKSNTEESIKGIVDLNLGVDYLYNKTVAVFLNLNNLTNNTYQRWYNYPSYGFNVMGGLKVTF